MIIHSRHRDYYDNILGYGRDETRHYIRNTEWIWQKDCPIDHTSVNWHNTSYRHRNPGLTSSTLVIICFCGKRYPIVCTENSFAFSYTEFETAIAKEIKQYGDRHSQQQRYSHSYLSTRRRRFNPYEKERVISLMSFFKDTRPVPQSVFDDIGCPYFAIWIYGDSYQYHSIQRESPHKVRVEQNPCLKDMDFQRIIDPYTAFQEVSMMLGNMAQSEKEMPKISDDMSIQRHGFDKWSFRKKGNKS